MKTVAIPALFAALALTACQTAPMAETMDAKPMAKMDTAAPAMTDAGDDAMTYSKVTVPPLSDCGVPANVKADNASRSLSTVVANIPPQYGADVKIMTSVLNGNRDAKALAWATECFGVSPANF